MFFLCAREWASAVAPAAVTAAKAQAKKKIDSQTIQFYAIHSAIHSFIREIIMYPQNVHATQIVAQLENKLKCMFYKLLMLHRSNAVRTVTSHEKTAATPSTQCISSTPCHCQQLDLYWRVSVCEMEREKKHLTLCISQWQFQMNTLYQQRRWCTGMGCVGLERVI